MSVNVTRVVKFRRKPVVLRGPQAWSDCAVGYPFECGAEGEEWKDVVIYGDNWYSCVKSHAKTPTNYPGSSEAEANGYWRLADKIEMVATKILLAQYALVKNLGVECVDMRDADGNIIFQAKDGRVICEGGLFLNAKVMGNITVRNMHYDMEYDDHGVSAETTQTLSDICRNVSKLQLGPLDKGKSRSIRILNDEYQKTAPGAVTLVGSDENVLIKSSSYSPGTQEVVLPGYGLGSGRVLELVGYHDNLSTKTYWLVMQWNTGLIEQ